jgi:cytochrome c-type biogenesis protein CcmF
MTPILIAVPFGPLLAWKRGDLLGVLQRLYVAAGLALIAGLVLFYLRHGGPVLAVLGLAAGFFLVFGAVTDLWYRAGVGKVAGNVAWRRLMGLPRSAFGTALAHAGLGITVLGIVAVTTFQTENITEMKPGGTADLGGYTLRFDGIQPGVGPNYTEDRARFTVTRGGVAVANVSSSKRLFTASRTATTEAGILTLGPSQLYVSLGDPTNDGGMVVRIWWKPFIICIWGGAIFMALGGFVSLSDRRLRVGAPSRKAKPVRPVMEPAE